MYPGAMQPVLFFMYHIKFTLSSQFYVVNTTITSILQMKKNLRHTQNKKYAQSPPKQGSQDSKHTVLHQNQRPFTLNYTAEYNA